MPTAAKATKRKLSHDAPVSPPPLKKRVQATTTQNAVSSFFTPTSQKPPERVQWEERAPSDNAPRTLLVGRYIPLGDSLSSDVKRNKIAAFDFDSTLVESASGKKFPTDAQDWKWWHSSVIGTLRKMYLEDGFRIVVISNQGGLSLKPDPKTPKGKVTVFKTKVSAVFSQLDLPVNIYAATEKDKFRKPRTGMWTELLKDLDIQELDIENSLFVGDAGGRQEGNGKPKDFSCSDRNFAENVGIKFHTPEEFFLKEPPRPFTRTFEPSIYLADSTAEGSQPYLKKNVLDIVLFCGSPGAGKSTFYFTQLEPLGYKRVNQDTLKTKREKCLKVASQELADGKSIVVDNTNADVEVRKEWIKLASKYNIPIRCVLFTTPKSICEHNDVVRALNSIMNPEKRTILPGMAFNGFAKRYQQPQLNEGFQDITEVAFKFSGTDIERSIWKRYWT